MSDRDPLVYPNAGSNTARPDAVSRRQPLAGSTATGVAATAGCLGGSDEPPAGPTVFVFNTGDGTVSLIDPDTNTVVGTQHLGLSSSFPSNRTPHG